MVCTEPPAAATFSNLPSTEKPINLLSGDQNGNTAPSVPPTGCAVTSVNRTQPELPHPSRINCGEYQQPAMEVRMNSAVAAFQMIAECGAGTGTSTAGATAASEPSSAKRTTDRHVRYAQVAIFREATRDDRAHVRGCAVVAHLDVRGLQIAMDDALLMRGFEGLGDLPRDRQRLVE